MELDNHMRHEYRMDDATTVVSSSRCSSFQKLTSCKISTFKKKEKKKKKKELPGIGQYNNVLAAALMLIYPRITKSHAKRIYPRIHGRHFKRTNVTSLCPFPYDLTVIDIAGFADVIVKGIVDVEESRFIDALPKKDGDETRNVISYEKREREPKETYTRHWSGHSLRIFTDLRCNRQVRLTQDHSTQVVKTLTAEYRNDIPEFKERRIIVRYPVEARLARKGFVYFNVKQEVLIWYHCIAVIALITVG